MEVKTATNVAHRTGLIKRPKHTTFIIRTGYSVICEIKGRPGVVLKVPLPFAEYDEAIEIEKPVYARLGKYANIVNIIEMNKWGIFLERVELGCFRVYYKEGGSAIPEERIKWCQDVAQVLSYIHQHNIRHTNLSGKNLLLNSARDILLYNFSGSSINDNKATVVAEVGFRIMIRTNTLNLLYAAKYTRLDQHSTRL